MLLLLTSTGHGQVANAGMRGLTSLEITADMGAGINLFNTLDAVASWIPVPHDLSSETVWGQPYTTPAMVASMAEQGFKTLRVPTTWFNHFIPDSDFTVDPLWMDRVETVVNYALDQDMYVILNLHHEDYDSGRVGSWLNTTYAMEDTVSYVLDRLWSQIASRFRDYSDYLIFETMNEPREVGGEQEWSGGTAEHRDVMNTLNKVALDAIRGTGGNNETRFVMLPQVGANPASALDAWEAPNNDTNLIVSVHGYTPFAFWHSDGDANTWGSAGEIQDLEDLMSSLHDHFIVDGVGVVIGEWGISDKDNYDQRVNYYEYYSRFTKKYGLVPVNWMFSFIRNSLEWNEPLLEDAIMMHFDSSFVEVKEIRLSRVNDTLDLGDEVQLVAEILPDTARAEDIIWLSSNEAVATVSDNGLVEVHAIGAATIKALTLGASRNYYLTVLDTLVVHDFFIEAERFGDQSGGVAVEACSDENGGWMIGPLWKDSWSSYQLGIDVTGTYKFLARVATATDGGIIEISVNEVVLAEVPVDGERSDGWQDWFSTDTVELELDHGDQDLKLSYRGESPLLFNFNSFELTYGPMAEADTSSTDTTTLFSATDPGHQVRLYPNPTRDRVSISSSRAGGSSLELVLTDLRGQVLLRDELVAGRQNKVLDLTDLRPGIYILRTGDERGWSCHKLLVR